ncbi:MAG TPA: hypothetical protein VFR97_00010 [Capillimicrobium sp.]|nr:hypothetical protein [Capillimicrobium sp.]
MRWMQAIRRAGLWMHLGLAVLVAIGVFAQVYLIGGYLFGAGGDALEAHRTVGFTVHFLELLILVTALVAWLPRADLGLSLLMAALGTAQIALANAERWAGALHPLGALLVLVLAAVLIRRDLALRRRGEHARSAVAEPAG